MRPDHRIGPRIGDIDLGVGRVGALGLARAVAQRPLGDRRLGRGVGIDAHRREEHPAAVTGGLDHVVRVAIHGNAGDDLLTDRVEDVVAAVHEPAGVEQPAIVGDLHLLLVGPQIEARRLHVAHGVDLVDLSIALGGDPNPAAVLGDGDAVRALAHVQGLDDGVGGDVDHIDVRPARARHVELRRRRARRQGGGGEAKASEGCQKHGWFHSNLLSRSASTPVTVRSAPATEYLNSNVRRRAGPAM